MTGEERYAILDQLNIKLTEIERALAERFRVRATIPLPDDGIVHRWLAFGKYSGHWMIMVETDNGKDVQATSIKSMPIQYRVMVVDYLQTLRAALIEAEQKVFEQAQVTLDRAQDFLDDLKKEIPNGK